MSDFPSYKKNETFHGFFPRDIQKHIIKDIFESGDPANYWYALRAVIKDLHNYISDHPIAVWKEKLEEYLE